MCQNLQLLKDGEGKSVTVATSSENRIKNRLSNISACNYPLTTDCMQLSHYYYLCSLCTDDDNRVVLKAMEGHSNDYINASYVDVSYKTTISSIKAGL